MEASSRRSSFNPTKGSPVRRFRFRAVEYFAYFPYQLLGRERLRNYKGRFQDKVAEVMQLRSTMKSRAPAGPVAIPKRVRRPHFQSYQALQGRPVTDRFQCRAYSHIVEWPPFRCQPLQLCTVARQRCVSKAQDQVGMLHRLSHGLVAPGFWLLAILLMDYQY
jgi:hypothetical protein